MSHLQYRAMLANRSTSRSWAWNVWWGSWMPLLGIVAQINDAFARAAQNEFCQYQRFVSLQNKLRCRGTTLSIIIAVDLAISSQDERQRLIYSIVKRERVPSTIRPGGRPDSKSVRGITRAGPVGSSQRRRSRPWPKTVP